MRNVVVLLIGALLLMLGIGSLLIIFPHPGVISLFSKEAAVMSLPEITLQHSGGIDPSGTYIVKGTATNAGTTPVVKVYIVVTTYDSSGADLGSAYDALVDLDPGETAPFSVESRPFYQGNRVTRYAIAPDFNAIPGI